MKKIIFSILILLILGGFFIWHGIYLPKDINLVDELWFISTSRNARVVEEKIFLIEKDQSLFQIAENLEKEGLIKGNFYFKAYALLQGYARSLQAGEYLLSPSMGIPEIVQKIISGDTAKIAVTIPEGFTVKQIEERLGLSLPGENLEGFLFPDTYQFPINVSGEEVVARMRENFNKKLTSDLKKEIEKKGKTNFEIITMASLIEKEVITYEDKEIVSGIFWKRIELGKPIESCATIAYIKGVDQWRYSFEDTRIDSPYNTYLNPGLPLGPICNPGLESIITAIYPQDSQYWFYLSTPEGETIFSQTLEEHNIAKEKYLK